MKILLNTTINVYNTQEVNDLLRRGYRFEYSRNLEAYVPKAIMIHENGESRSTNFEELITRRENGERFLKVAGKSIYVTVDAEKYTKIMQPIWREDRRAKRELECLYKNNRKLCQYQSCEKCLHQTYFKESFSYLADKDSKEWLFDDDVADTLVRQKAYEEMYKAVSNLAPTDRKILLMKANGMSERDIAKKLGFKSKTSVHKRLGRFLPPLRKHLESFL